MQHSENHHILLKIFFLYFHKFLSKRKLFWKSWLKFFIFVKTNWFYTSACVILTTLESIFWKFDIFILWDQNFQDDPTIIVFNEPNSQKHLKNSFSWIILKILDTENGNLEFSKNILQSSLIWEFFHFCFFTLFFIIKFFGKNIFFYKNLR